MKQFTDYLKSVGEIGFVRKVDHFITNIEGLPHAKINEIVVLENGEIGQVLTVHPDSVEVIFFSKNPLKVGLKVVRTDEFASIPVGDELLGHAIDPLGDLLDESLPALTLAKSLPIDVVPLGIADRKRINTQCETGVTVVDLLVPMGLGQRELVIGDRKTGKTAFILQTMLNQARMGTICIYAGIGKKMLDIKKVEEFFKKNNIHQNTVIIATSSHDPASLIYLTPYAAMTIAEYFRDQGKNVLLILDDLTTHAKFYREISLLDKRFPGRNSYPGDIFYAHAKLLERAGNFKTQDGEGEVSITCIPVAETAQGDLSGYIPTNLMSMTDGHIFFDTDLFTKGRRPAINPFLSVTRVGRQTQSSLNRDITRELSSFLTYLEKMQNFSHFGAELNQSIKTIFAMGDKILSYLNQTSRAIIPLPVSTFTFGLLWYGIWKDQSTLTMKEHFTKIQKCYLEDPEFHTFINTFSEPANSLNQLLANIKANLPSIQKFLPEIVTTTTPEPVPVAAEEKTADAPQNV